MVESNGKLQTIYNESDPDIVAETIHCELNQIINTLAPKSRTQVKNQVPYLDYETKQIKQNSEHHLTLAIQNRDQTEWIKLKTERNSYFKQIEINKKAYFETKLNHPRLGFHSDI